MITDTSHHRPARPRLTTPADGAPHAPRARTGPGSAGPRQTIRRGPVTRRTVATLASAALGALFLAGCGSPAPALVPGSPETATAPVAADSPTPPLADVSTETPHPLLAGPVPELAPDPPPAEVRSVAPELPADTPADEAGAVEAVRHALNVLEHARFTGDLASWERLTAATCGGCEDAAEEVRAAHAAGNRIAGPYLQWLGTPEATSPGAATWHVDLRARVPETREIDADGETTFRAAYRLDVAALVAHTDGAWVVRELETTELPVE